MKTLIIGIGNTMLADDAVGPLIAEALKNCGAPALNLGLDAFSAASHLEGVDLAVFIDSLDQTYGQPGEIIQLQLDPARLTPEETAKAFSRELSAHHPTPADIVLLAHASGIFRGEAILIGIVAQSLEFGQPLTPTIINRVGSLCERLREILPHIEINCQCVEKTFKQLLAT
jgi:hydrogenase maturation protease